MTKKTLIAALLAAVAGIAPSQAVEHVVTQKSKRFSKVAIEAKMGDVLVFKNAEKDVTHNVYSISEGNEFDLKTQKPGETSKVPLSPSTHKVGKMEVECAIHPTMKLIVNIKP